MPVPRPRGWTLVSVAVLVSLLVSAAHAQEESADALFEEGRRAIFEGRFRDAARSLERSLEIERTWGTAYNLAVARRGYGDAIGAVELLEQLRAREYPDVPSEFVASAAEMLEEERARICALRIRIEGPARAALRIDGDAAGEVGAEWTEVAANPGAHTIAAVADDHDTATERIELTDGERRDLVLELRPDQRPGVLVLRGESPEAILEIVGVARGRDRLSRRLEAGEYVVRSTVDGDTVESRVTIPAGRRIELELVPSGTSLFESPWFWIVGAGVLGAGVGVLLWFLFPVETSNDGPFWLESSV